MKTNSNWLLNTIRVLLSVIWYVNITLILVAFTLLTWKFTTSDFSEFSAPVKYPEYPQTVNIGSLTSDTHQITILHDQGLLKMKLKNTTGYVAIAYFFFAALEVLAMTIIYQLCKFFDTLKQNIPFQYDNVRRLKIIALCFALLTLLHILLGISTSLILREQVKNYNTMAMVWSENFIGLILGAVIYVIADVFKYGFSLKKENEEFV